MAQHWFVVIEICLATNWAVCLMFDLFAGELAIV